MKSGEGDKIDGYLLAVQHSEIPAPGYLNTGFTPHLSPSSLFLAILNSVKSAPIGLNNKDQNPGDTDMNNHTGRQQITQLVTFSAPPSTGWV